MEKIQMTKYLNAAPTQHAKLLAWVEEWVAICKPDAVYWCDGSAAEYDRLADEMVESGLATRLAKKPHSVLSALMLLTLPVSKPVLTLPVSKKMTQVPPITGSTPLNSKRPCSVSMTAA